MKSSGYVETQPNKDERCARLRLRIKELLDEIQGAKDYNPMALG